MAQLQSRNQIADRALPRADQRQRDRANLLLLIGDGAEHTQLDQAAAVTPPAYSLIEAATPTQALALWLAGQADWVVLDLAWAAGSGLELLTALGELCQQRPLPVLVLVGAGQERAALEAMKLGAADYLFKADLTADALWASLALLQQASGAQRQTADALDKARQHYQNLVENSPDIIERFDRNLRHLYVSPALAKILGIDTAAFLGKTCRELGLDDTMVNDWEAAAALVLATGEKQAIEFTTPTLIGVRQFEMAIAPEWSEGGEVESLLCISRDISDRVAAQQAQQRLLSEAQMAQRDATAARDSLARVFDRINDGIIAFDRDSRCVYLNSSAEQILGRSALAIIGKSVWTEFPEAVDTPIYEVYHRAIEQQQPEFLEYYFPPLDGWFEVRLYPDSDGITVYFTDISDRKTAAAQHQQTEQLRQELFLLELILESILAGYWDVDFVANTDYMSPGLKRMFGYAAHELATAADTWQNLIVPEDLPPVLDNLKQHIQSRGEVPYCNEVRYRHKDGSIVWVICAGQVIAWDEAGQPLRMVGCHVDITPLKQAEAQLRKNQAHLQAAQRIGNLGSWEFEVATDRITWSDQVYRIFGLEVGANPLSFEVLQSFFYPDDQTRHRQTVAETLATHQPYDDEFCIVRADGSQGYIHVKGEALVDGVGQLTHLTGTVQDISDRKRDEAQRQQVEAQLRNLSMRLSLALESGKIGSWERDLITDAVNSDHCLIDIYGLQPSEQTTTYQSWLSQVYADDVQRVETAIQTTLHHGTPYDIEFRVWKTDGDLRWIKSNALVQHDPQGQPIKIVGINYDITEAKRSEERFHDLSLRLKLALDSGGFGVWEWDLATDMVKWDQRLIGLYGFESLGRPITYQDWLGRVHADDAQRVEAAIQATLDQNIPYDTEFRIWHSNGELRWIRGSALVYRTQQGEPISMVGINYDITEAKRAEAYLLRTSAQLEASNRELEAFAYSVSHDLRSPLRAIDGFSRALLEDYGDRFDEEGQDYFDRIRHNVSHMGQLIDDLLRLSRVSRSAFGYASVNLSALVQELVDELRDEQPDRTVTVTIAPDLTVTADPTLMRVAIANLVQNAWKFTAHHPSARIEFGTVIQGGERIYYLRDDGAGFDMAYANKLFGVFQRLHNTAEFPGTGIGLATVQRAIHRQGGRVWAEAAVEQGTTFYFTLPQVSPETEGAP